MGGQLWAKIALNLADNPKVIGLSDAAFRAFIEAILYSRQHLTDGFLDARVVAKRWGLEVAQELTSNDPSNPSWLTVEGGFQIHHFCEHQTTNDDIQEMKAKKSRAGKASVEARKQRKLNEDSTQFEQGVEQVLNTVSTEGQPETETETETETEIKPLVPLPTAKANTQSKRRFVPDDWMPSEANLAWTKQAAPAMNIKSEVERMIDWSKSKGAGFIDWERAWKNWVKNCVERNPALTIQPPPPKKQFTGYEDDDV
jgi:hypothetical protein